MIPVYTKDGQFARHQVRETNKYVENGYVVTEYVVLVLDRTISGDYRYEHAMTRVRVEP